jgi:hypothetical protein
MIGHHKSTCMSCWLYAAIAALALGGTWTNMCSTRDALQL